MYSVGVCWSPRMSPHQQGNPGRDADNGRGGGQANASFVLRVHFLQKQFKQSNKFFHNYLADFRQHVNFGVFRCASKASPAPTLVSQVCRRRP